MAEPPVLHFQVKTRSDYRWGDNLLGFVALIWLAHITGHWMLLWIILGAAFLLNVVGAFAFRWHLDRRNRDDV